MPKPIDPERSAMEAPDGPSVSVVMPAYNEGASIGPVVSRVRELHPGFEVIVIDDGSTDDTSERARKAGADVYSHPYNIGNGAAIKSGIRRATGDIIVFMDADNQHDPSRIDEMLAWFPDFDMVVGARSGIHHASLGRLVGNWVFNRLASYVAKFPVKDLTSGFRAVKGSIARSHLFLLPNTYSYPTTLTLSVLRSGRTVKYLPIAAHRRRTGKSRINIVRDGVRFFMMITKICTLYSPMRVFLPVSFLMFLLGALNYVYTFVAMGRFTNMSALLFVASILVFMMSLISEQISQMRFERRTPDRSRPGKK